MQFDSFAQFLSMNGHGFYVWLSYGVTILLFLLLAFVSINQKKHTIKHILKRQKREIKLKQAAQQQAESEVTNESTS